MKRLLLTDTYQRIVVFSRDEFKHFAMQEQLGDHPRLRYFLADVRDEARLRLALHGITDVIHAAALKWVASGGYNPTEIKQTNVDGTVNLVTAAIESGVKRVMVVSSDKAVHATNVYGKSKAMAEEIAISMNAYGFPRGTKIAAVRYGNVLWSRGSVAYRFQTQRPPFKLTDRRMTRFGIRMSDAVTFVLAGLTRMRGGEVFIPKLPSFRVEDVANAVYHRHHLVRDKTPIEIVGHRAGGEKLHEMLIAEEESSHTIQSADPYGEFYVVEPNILAWDRAKWEGLPVPEGWSYTSEKNDHWLSEEDHRSGCKIMPCVSRFEGKSLVLER